MFKQLLSVLFATQVALTTCAYCQSVQNIPSEVLSDSLIEPSPHDDIHERPFVSGHSIVPHTARTRFESDGDCGDCKCQNTCVCGDKKAQRKAALQYKYWGYPELFCERPHGSLIRAHLDAQIERGIAGQMIVYKYDFFDIDHPRANALKPAGFRSVSRIIDFAAVSPTPIMIESTGDNALDAGRRLTVINALTQMSFPVAEDQVITIARDPFGISGDEAELSYGAMLQRAQSSQESDGRSGSGISIPVFPVSGDSGR